jgi:hypothetical protein
MMVSERSEAKWLAHAVIAGFCATVVMLVVALNAYGICAILAHNDPTHRSWIGALSVNPVTSAAHNFLYGSLALHLAVGLAWAVAYAAWFEPRLSGSGWWRGLKFSLLPWLLSLVVFLPAVGAGFLGLSLGAGPLPIIGNLILHLAYGATLGVVYAPLGDMLPNAQFDRAEVMALGGSEVLAAKGLLIGLTLGLLCGIAGLYVSRLEAWNMILGLPVAWYLLSTTAAGGSLGLLIGSLMGLPTSLPTPMKRI